MPNFKKDSIRWLRIAVLPITAAIIFLSIGFFWGVHHANVKQNKSIGEYAVESLWNRTRILKGLEHSKDVAATKLAAMSAEKDLESIMKFGSLVERPEHLEFRASVLRAYKNYRDTHPQLYEFPTYFPDESKQRWLESQKSIQKYLEENSAPDVTP